MNLGTTSTAGMHLVWPALTFQLVSRCGCQSHMSGTTLPRFIATSDSVWTQPHFLTSNLCWHNIIESLLTPKRAHHLSLSPLEWSRKDARAAATSLPLCPEHFKHMESHSDACLHFGSKKKKKVPVLNLHRLKNHEELWASLLGQTWQQLMFHHLEAEVSKGGTFDPEKGSEPSCLHAALLPTPSARQKRGSVSSCSVVYLSFLHSRVINMQTFVREVLCCALTPPLCWLEPRCELTDTNAHS